MSDGGAGSGAGTSGGAAGTSGGAGTGAQAGTSGGQAGTTGAAGVGAAGHPANGTPSGSGPFPSTSIFYQDISKAPVDAESATVMAGIAPAWTGGLGIDVSFTILNAADNVARRSFMSDGDDPDCDTAPVPLPPGGNIEGSDNYACADGGDCHLLVYQGKRLYEMYQANVSSGLPTGGTFTGGCLVVWDLARDYWQPVAPPNYSRGDHCNGADAADFPMAPLILTTADVESGTIKHAMRFTIPNARIRKDVYVHPATHIGGPTGGDNTLPYGARLRLRGDFDLSKLPSDQARVVARALQTYGMFLADGGNLYISATTDAADAVSTSALRSLRATDFEMVEAGPRLRWRDYQCERTVVTD